MKVNGLKAGSTFTAKGEAGVGEAGFEDPGQSRQPNMTAGISPQMLYKHIFKSEIQPLDWNTVQKQVKYLTSEPEQLTFMAYWESD